MLYQDPSNAVSAEFIGKARAFRTAVVTATVATKTPIDTALKPIDRRLDQGKNFCRPEHITDLRRAFDRMSQRFRLAYKFDGDHKYWAIETVWIADGSWRLTDWDNDEPRITATELHIWFDK